VKLKLADKRKELAGQPVGRPTNGPPRDADAIGVTRRSAAGLAAAGGKSVDVSLI